MAIVDFQEFTEGLYTDVAPILVPPNALYLMSNVLTTYKLGSITKRLGYSKIGTAPQATKPITGLFNFRQSASTQKILATVNNSAGTATDLWWSTGSTWTQITGTSAWSTYEDAKVEMESFIGYCFFVGYDSTDGVWLPNASLTGTTFGTTNTTSMPNAKYIKRYRDRLYIGNCYSGSTAYPYRVYFSSIPSAGTISWTVASDFLDVDYSEEVTGLAENWDYLLVFTEYSCYFYNQEAWKKTWDVGCSNHRTVKNSGAYIIWANMDGVFASTGGRPENIAGRIKDFIGSANMSNAFAEVVDEEYHLYLGTVTVNGVTYANCAVIYDIASQTWRVHEYYDTPTIFSKYYSSGEDFMIMGVSDGDIHQLSKYTDTTPVYADDGQPINSWFQTGALSFGVPSSTKKISKVFSYADRGQGLLLKARVIDRTTMSLSSFKSMGNVTQYINEHAVNPDKGNFLQIEGVENGSLPYWQLFGFSVDVDIDTPAKK